MAYDSFTAHMHSKVHSERGGRGGGAVPKTMIVPSCSRPFAKTAGLIRRPKFVKGDGVKSQTTRTHGDVWHLLFSDFLSLFSSLSPFKEYSDSWNS